MPQSSSTPIQVLVIDYGVGNHGSVVNALKRLGIRYAVSARTEDIEKAPAYILPGVGAFAEAMHNLKRLGIIDVLREQVIEKKKPILGICLGMQILADDSSENGQHAGLGFIPGHVVRIENSKDIRVPHVGWNDLKIQKKDPLFLRLDKRMRFYFDHSYQFKTDATYVAATCEYGEMLTAAVQHKNIFGAQFHPEKSQVSGLRLLRAFFNYAV
ncbi:MAG: imidazole glycerol phosphate synthase subunit HisH [Patescibacteria group bacterium]